MSAKPKLKPRQYLPFILFQTYPKDTLRSPSHGGYRKKIGVQYPVFELPGTESEGEFIGFKIYEGIRRKLLKMAKAILGLLNLRSVRVIEERREGVARACIIWENLAG